ESYLNDLIANAGGINIACHMPREWLHLNQEQIIQENPEVIVVLASGHKDFARAREWFLKHPHLRNVRAIQEKRVCFLEENIASRFGPRLLDAYFELARLLHPELFLEEE
ncbi:MAG: cobalamin-binding protein, partial [Candidatus Aminicenantes bacterium]|nr:cobalamin-binding protein [Candidatus Aminicenantes bacterium]